MSESAETGFLLETRFLTPPRYFIYSSSPMPHRPLPISVPVRGYCYISLIAYHCVAGAAPIRIERSEFR
jgi:hypothetical protein